MLTPIVELDSAKHPSCGLPETGTIKSWSCYKPDIPNVSGNWALT